MGKSLFFQWMATINDEQKFIDAKLSTINHFKKINISQLFFRNFILNFNMFGAKFALPDEEWDIYPENILVGLPAEIRPCPNSPMLAGITTILLAQHSKF